LLHTILQAVIDAEAAEHIGAEPHERTDHHELPARSPTTLRSWPLPTRSTGWFVSARVGNYQSSPILGPLMSQLWVK
jgi:hypothetical protein